MHIRKWIQSHSPSVGRLFGGTEGVRAQSPMRIFLIEHDSCSPAPHIGEADTWQPLEKHLEIPCIAKLPFCYMLVATSKESN